MPLRGDMMICAILGLTALPAAAEQSLCALTDTAPDMAPEAAVIAGLSAPRQAALNSLCQNLRQGLGQGLTQPSPADAAGEGLYLQLVGASRTGMTLRLVLRQDGQETPGEALTISSADSDRPSPASLQRLADLLIKTAPLP